MNCLVTILLIIIIDAQVFINILVNIIKPSL